VEQMNRQLLANLVHELGRPLGAFYSAIHALQQGADEDLTIRQELLAGMAGEVRRFKRLLDDLARLYDRTIGRLELECQPIVLNQWLPQVLSSWREAAADKGLQWQATIPADLPILEADPDRLGQALGNLLSNAIKYTPSGGTVSIEAGFGDSAIWIRVSDTGPGIAPEDQAHIFTPFYRTREANHFKQGMGLGLSIAHDLIVAHKGRLEVESRPGLGSRFTLFAPITLS
jgi:signal transduction histidine kinase